MDLVTSRDPASQSNEHGSFVTSSCELPLAVCTLEPCEARCLRFKPTTTLNQSKIPTSGIGILLWRARRDLNPRHPA